MIDDALKMIARACRGESPLTACESALRWCAQHRGVVVELGSSVARLRLVDRLSCEFKAILYERLSLAMELEEGDAEDLSKIVRDVAKTTEETEDHIAAAAVRAFAEVVDAVAAPRFLEELRIMDDGGHGIVRGVGDAVPIVHPDLKAIFGSLRARTESLEYPHDRTKRLTIVPDYATVGVRLHFAEAGRDLALAQGAVFAVGLPMSSEADLRSLESGAFWMTPREPDRNLDRVRRILESVGDAAICVLPELCLADGQIEAVRGMIPNGPSVVYAGSAHVAGSDGRRNRGYLCFRGDWLAHHKFVPFQDGDRMEPIRTDPPELQVLVTDQWTLSFVICKDLLPRTTGRLLADLGVRVVLVAAFSKRLRDFVAATEQITTYSQGTVLIANTTGREDAVAAVLAEPREPRSRVVNRKEIQIPAVVRMKLGSDEEPSVTLLPDG